MSYRRRYVRRAPRAKWNPIFNDLSVGFSKQPSVAYTNVTANIVTNELPFQLTDNAKLMNGYPAAAPILKVRHPSITMIIPYTTNSAYATHVELFMMFVPQGVEITEALIVAHPEWIMARRVIPIVQGATTFTSMKSPLSRNLNSGDKIAVAFKMHWNDGTPNSTTLATQIQTSCVTRAN